MKLDKTIMKSFFRYLLIGTILLFMFYPPYSSTAQKIEERLSKYDTVEIPQDTLDKEYYNKVKLLESKQNKGKELLKTLTKESSKPVKNKYTKKIIFKQTVSDTLVNIKDSSIKVLVVSDTSFKDIVKPHKPNFLQRLFSKPNKYDKKK